MSDDIFDFEAEDAEDKAEPDPATIARLDQEEAAFAQERERWIKVYGFDHACHCGQDYASGKTTEVTHCFVELVNEALARCAASNMEIGMLSGMLDKLVKLSNDLVSMMEELGHTDELQKYFGAQDDMPVQEEVETTDLDSEFEQMILLNDEDEDDDDELTPA